MDILDIHIRCRVAASVPPPMVVPPFSGARPPFEGEHGIYFGNLRHCCGRGISI